MAEYVAHCSHVRTKHRHGTDVAYKNCGCRCRACTDAASRASAYRNHFGATSIMPALGCLRRLQALIALGWTQTRLDVESGMRRGAVNHLLHRTRTRVQRPTYQRVCAVYERLEHATPPEDHHAAHARAIARRNGWAPPAAWDDIDDPDCEPSGWIGKPTSADLYEAICELRADGETWERIGIRLGKSATAVERSYHRHKAAA